MLSVIEQRSKGLAILDDLEISISNFGYTNK